MKPSLDEYLDPILAHLDDRPEPESTIHRVWLGVEAREAAPRRSLLWVGLAAAALVALSIGVSQWRPGPLEFADGSAIVAAEGAGNERMLRFDDGSHIELGEGARVVPTQNDDEAIRFDLDRGRVRFSVQPGGPREWRVRTERLEVRVVGTEFIVDAAPPEVRVERGRVEVRDRQTGELRMLSAGEVWRVPRAGPVANTERRRESPAVELPSIGASREPRAVVDPGAEATPSEPRTFAAPEWRAVTHAGEHEAAFEAAFEALDAAPPASVADRMLAVDTARRTGHLDDAVSRLVAILRDYPSDDATPLAAVTLGRIERRRGRDAAAVDAFERAKALGVPASFADEVCAELALARHRLGNRHQARLEAAGCVGLSPDSPFAASLRRLLRGE